MRLTPVLTACALLAGSGCARDVGASGGRLDVVVAVYPLAYVAERIGGAHVKVTDVTPVGAEPHDVELTPAQVALVQGADLVVRVRGLQAALDDVAHGANVLDASTVDSSPSGVAPNDPHLWLDPVRVIALASAIATRLGERDTAHRAEYLSNAAGVVTDLTALDTETRIALGHCARTEIVTGHEAFGHFAARYGLRQTGIEGVSPEGEPSPKRLAQIAAYVRAHHVTTVFAEALLSPKVARTIAHETGARVAVLDPIEGATDGLDYLALMRRNVSALRTALGCS